MICSGKFVDQCDCPTLVIYCYYLSDNCQVMIWVSWSQDLELLRRMNCDAGCREVGHRALYSEKGRGRGAGWVTPAALSVPGTGYWVRHQSPATGCSLLDPGPGSLRQKWVWAIIWRGAGAEPGLGQILLAQSDYKESKYILTYLWHMGFILSCWL